MEIQLEQSLGPTGQVFYPLVLHVTQVTVDYLILAICLGMMRTIKLNLSPTRSTKSSKNSLKT